MPRLFRYLSHSTPAFLFIGFIVLMSIVGMNFWLGERAQSNFDDAIAARDTRVAAVELRNAVQVAESSQRGFIITGNEIYLAPYQSAKIQMQRRLLALQGLLPSYPNADASLKRLSDILKLKFDELDQTIELKRNHSDADVMGIFRTNQGKALTDEANVFFAGIIGRADERLTSGVAEQSRNSAWVRFVSAIGALVIVFVVGVASLGTARDTKELRETHNQVTSLNSQLEERVSTRTADLAQARDRAEVLLSEVNHRVSNSLALVSALVNLQSRALKDSSAREVLSETQERIFAISLVHKRLYASTDVRSVALEEYLTGLLDHLRTSLRSQHHGVGLSFEIEQVELATDASISLGVIVTELVTNAFKYAYPDGVGEIRVSLKKLPDEKAELIIEDDGVGKSNGGQVKGTGVGTKIIHAMCVNLGTQIEYRNRQPGTGAHLVFSTGKHLAFVAPSSGKEPEPV